jgi:hypothetical protein
MGVGISEYNERLNSETGGSKTPRIHWVARKHTVILVLVVTKQETVDLTRLSGNQST